MPSRLSDEVGQPASPDPGRGGNSHGRSKKNPKLFATNAAEDSGTTPADFAFLGVARARESVNRGVQNNILQFLQALETANVNKPMFPGAAPKATGQSSAPSS
jgi:hypothetical protein